MTTKNILDNLPVERAYRIRQMANAKFEDMVATALAAEMYAGYSKLGSVRWDHDRAKWYVVNVGYFDSLEEANKNV